MAISWVTQYHLVLSWEPWPRRVPCSKWVPSLGPRTGVCADQCMQRTQDLPLEGSSLSVPLQKSSRKWEFKERCGHAWVVKEWVVVRASW